MRKVALILGVAAAVALAILFFSSSQGTDASLAAPPAADPAKAARLVREHEQGASPATAAGERAAAPTGFAPPPIEEGRPSATPLLEVPATAKDGFVEISVKARGLPAAAAEVKLYLRGAFDRGAGHADWRLAGVAKTSADGVAKLPARPGSYLAVARNDRMAPARKPFTRAQGQATTKVSLDLEAGATLEGRTVQRGGQEPVALASLTITPAGNAGAALGFGGRRGGLRGGPGTRPDAPVEEITLATSDARGRFRASGLEPGPYRVEAQAPGHAKGALSRVQVPSAAEVVLELSASGFIEGTVTGGDGKPAASAQIAAIGGGGLVAATATEQGTFSMEVDPRSYKVSAQKGSQAVTLETPVVVAPGQTVRGVMLQLVPASAIEGTVATSQAGAPIPNASVTLSPHQGEGQAGRAVADARGAFTVELPPGSYDVATTADGFAPDVRRGVTLLASQRFPLRIELQGVGAVSGIVKGAGGPVEGAVINAATIEGGGGRRGMMAMMQGPAGPPPEVRSGPDGRFRLDGLTPGRARLTTHRDGSSLGDTQTVDIPEGGVAQVEVTLRDEGVLTGRVVTKSGAPLKAPAAVRAMPSGGAMMILGPGGVASTETDLGGAYRLTLPAASYNVSATAASTPGFAMPRTRNGATVQAGQTANKDLTLDDDSDAAVTGVVLEPSGEPSVGAIVRVLGTTPGARTMMVMPVDEQGRFTVAGTRAQLGALDVTASNGGRTGKASVAVEQIQVTVQLLAAGRIKGHVSGATQVQGFRVTVASAGGFGARMGGQDLEFAADKFDVDDVPPGDVIVSVKTRDGRAGDAKATIAAGQPNQVEVQLKDISTVAGRILGPDGAPVRGAMVAVDGEMGFHGAGSDQTTAEGRFKLANVAPGEHSLRIFAPPASFQRRPFTVAAGQPLDLGDLKLDAPKADPGTIGANLRPDSDGVAVAFVLPGGPAETAGLRAGDLVTAVDGAAVKLVADATARIGGAPGTPVTLTVSRSGNAIAVPVTRAR